MEEGAERMQKLEDVADCCEMLSSGHDMAASLELHKTWSIKHPIMNGQRAPKILLFSRGSVQLTVIQESGSHSPQSCSQYIPLFKQITVHPCSCEQRIPCSVITLYTHLPKPMKAGSTLEKKGFGGRERGLRG